VRWALLALAIVVLAVTGVAIATPVPVLTVSDGRREVVALLIDGGQFHYEYRHSIYDVSVSEVFQRSGDRLDFLHVITSDVRVIEYLRWDSEIRSAGFRSCERTPEVLCEIFVADAPTSDVADLVIRISPGAKQRLSNGDWGMYLQERFGDTVVRVKLERPGFLPALLRGLTW
jgi:hypothetical protein